MKQKMFLAVAFVFTMAATAFAQSDLSANLDKEIKKSEKRIEQLNRELSGYESSDSIACVQSLRSAQRVVDSLSRYSPTTILGKKAKDAAIKDETAKLRIAQERLGKFSQTAYKKEERKTLMVLLNKYQEKKLSLIASTEVSAPKNAFEDSHPERLTNYAYNQMSRGLNMHKQVQTQKNDERWEDANYKRMMNSPVKADSIKGYMGIISNLSVNSRIKFTIYHIDNSGSVTDKLPVINEFTAPGQKLIKYLLPGRYVCYATREGVEIGKQVFPVSSELVGVMGEQVHWFAVREGY